MMKIGNPTKLLLALVAILQLVSMYKLQLIQDKSTSGESRSILSSTSKLRGQRQAQQQRQKLSHQVEEESFSACLMIMDDNAHLIEWLAYHYTRLPLRRLIVAVDPRSQTSPSEILQRWDGLMDITEWTDIDFMPPTLMDKHLKIPSHDHTALTKLFRQRQEEFYTRCMARLKYEGRTWTAFVDTDEYILINEKAQGKYKIPKGPSENHESSGMTVLQGIRKAEKENEFLANELSNSPCVAMPRLAFGVKESRMEEIQNRVPFGFDGENFQTLRWRWHAGTGMKKVNKISKSLLDVSRVESELFVPTKEVMVHLPSKTHCHGGKEEHLWVLNLLSPIVVHHYAGSWEQWSHRKDTRNRRTRENYEKLMYDKQSDDRIRPWLQEFVSEVGLWQARGLLRDVGEVPDV